MGCLCQPAGRRRHPLFLSDATINGCGVGVDSQYLEFIRQYLAELMPNLNVFDTLPTWQHRKVGLTLITLVNLKL
jgi:hypothetical protein